jgi:hypothetical protein
MLTTIIRLAFAAAFVAWISAWINERRLRKQNNLVIPPLTAEKQVEAKEKYGKPNNQG